MTTPRDLTANLASLNYAVESHERMARSAIASAEREPDNPHQYSLIQVPSHMARGLLQRYARGDAMQELQAYYRDTYVPTLRSAALLSKKFFPEHRLRLHFEQPASWMLLFAIVCFDEEGTEITHLEEWFTPDCNQVLCAMLLTGLVPGFTYVSEYDRDSHAMPFEDEVVSALLQPPETYSQALGAYMKQWPKLMKRYGYREHIDENKSRFDQFPLHLGVATCAFDVDDSAFRDLPYYPRELVDYYRAHRRHTRDAWRTGVIDPRIGLPDNARPQPKKKYALSKAEAYERWVELVCGEQPGLIERARKALGKRKTMPTLEVALEALASARLGVYADLKDDDSVAVQAAAMCQSWQLPALKIPVMELQGPARITVVLNTLDNIDTQAGQRLAVLDNDDDNWHAVLYSYHHEAEFATLCEQLAIKRLTRDQWQ